jgi:hypothetical protein
VGQQEKDSERSRVADRRVETERDTDRQRERERDRERETHTHRGRERQKSYLPTSTFGARMS